LELLQIALLYSNFTINKCILQTGENNKLMKEGVFHFDNIDPMTPFGLGLSSYYQGNREAGVIISREDGFSAPLPASYFFRDETAFSSIEAEAIRQCRGHVLDIGAGAGIHSLSLQDKGYQVTAVEIDPELVKILVKRGVRDVRQANIINFEEGTYDTLLLLGHGIGICGDLAGLDKFLQHARKLLGPGGQIILDSTDVSKSTDPRHLTYHESNRKAGRYIGDVVFRMEFGDIVGPYFHWLHVEPGILAKHAMKVGWNCEVVSESEDGEYLARIQ
jgi:SAM-dependent methyltransferase